MRFVTERVVALERERAELDRERAPRPRPGMRAAQSEARASPAAPAMQPSPKMGVRFTDGFRPSRFTSFASSDGVEIPVTVTK